MSTSSHYRALAVFLDFLDWSTSLRKRYNYIVLFLEFCCTFPPFLTRRKWDHEDKFDATQRKRQRKTNVCLFFFLSPFALLILGAEDRAHQCDICIWNNICMVAWEGNEQQAQADLNRIQSVRLNSGADSLYNLNFILWDASFSFFSQLAIGFLCKVEAPAAACWLTVLLLGEVYLCSAVVWPSVEELWWQKLGRACKYVWKLQKRLPEQQNIWPLSLSNAHVMWLG